MSFRKQKILKRRRNRKIRNIGLIVASVLGLGACGAVCSAQHLDRQTYTATVTDKEIKRYGSGEDSKDKYLIFTELEDGTTRVFENTDSLIELKWDSSDLYGKIQEGETYDFETYGWRIPFLSQYENIVEVRHRD